MKKQLPLLEAEAGRAFLSDVQREPAFRTAFRTAQTALTHGWARHHSDFILCVVGPFRFVNKNKGLIKSI